MSQRISDLGLQDFERAARSREPFPHGWGQLLVVEVRRLRGLIVASVYYPDPESLTKGQIELMDEANAIREEQGKA